MPRCIPWRDTALYVDQATADEVLSALKAFDITKSNTLACTLCADSIHKMRYRLLECSSEACSKASTAKCPWRGKVVTCLDTTCVCIYDYNEHLTATDDPKKQKLTETQKEFCRELADQHLRPMRIRLALSRKFDTSLVDLPSLTTVQNFVNYYSRTYLENHDRLQELKTWIHAHAYNGSEQMTQPFTFGWEYDSDGNLVVGNGSDERPFIVGLTTKALMLRMMLPPEAFVLHVDATYKTNYVDYPVVVLGVSDRSRGFHLVALFIVSQETQPVFEAVLMALRRLYFWIAGKELVVQYAMADGDKAQCNALHSVFGGFARFQFLMCFFHVMENVQKAVKQFPSHLSAAVQRDIYDLHVARTKHAFLVMRDAVLQKWREDPRLFEFSQYMSSQWLYGSFSTWQAYATPIGFASTNNPVETFNAVIKRDYTLRRRLKMGTLLREFSACCQDQSMSKRQFQFGVLAGASLTRRVADLARGNLLAISCCHPIDIESAGHSAIVRVKAVAPHRIVVAPNKRSEEGIAVSAQMGVNYARMEIQNQPLGGWSVDLWRKTCPCNYWFMFGSCVHLLYAHRMTAHVDSQGRDVLVNRKKRRRGDTGGAGPGGRPRFAGPALCFE